MNFSIIWRDYDTGEDDVMGSGTLEAKKKRGSAYGYVATKLVIKRNGKSF